jgi:hypothetical protein
MTFKTTVSLIVFALVTAGFGAFALAARPIDTVPQAPPAPKADGTTLVYVGPGGVNCGRWTEDRAAGKTVALDDVVKWWAAGFLHGVTMTLGVPHPQDSAETIFSRVADYCAANPGAVVSEAGLVVLKGMMNQPPRP